jgi:hypothetical protein
MRLPRLEVVLLTQLPAGPTKDMTSNRYVRNLWHKDDIAAALEAVLSLWARACRWSVRVGGGDIPLSGDLRQRRFREMVRRAVHHRAHAEWLVQELNELRQGKLGGQSS